MPLAGLVMLGLYWSAAAPVQDSRELMDAPTAGPWLVQSTFIASSLEDGSIGYVDVSDGNELSSRYTYALIGQPRGMSIDSESGALQLESPLAPGLRELDLVATERSAPNKAWRFPLRLDVREAVTVGRIGDQILHKVYHVDSGQYGHPEAGDYTNVLFNIRKAVLEDQQAAGDGNFNATIYFRRGRTYDYTANNWLAGLQHVSVLADPEDNPAAPRPQLRNVRQAFVFDSEIAILGTGGSNAFDLVPDKLKIYSPAIHSAEPGQSRVRLKDAADAALIKAGRWYLIGSYDQQLAGHPPNMRYFDYVRVAAVLGDEVVLDRRLKHRHRDDYFEEEANPASLGVARIIPLDLGGKNGLLPTSDARLTVRLRVKDIEFVSNPSTDDPSRSVLYIAGALDATFENCIMPRPVPSIVRNMHFIGGSIGSSEPDKLVGTLIFDKVISGEIGGATGVDFMLIRNSTIAPLQVSPRHLHLKQTVIDGTTNTHLWYPVTFAYNGPVLSAEFDSVIFKINPDHGDTRMMPAIQRPSLMIGSEADWDGDVLVIPRSVPSFQDWQSWLFKGMIVYSEQRPSNWGVVSDLNSPMNGRAIWVKIDWKQGQRPLAGKLAAGRGYKLRIDDTSELTGKASWDRLSGGFMWERIPASFGAVRPAFPTNIWNKATVE
jgi:hypothetical protein